MCIHMNKEAYEPIILSITQFDEEDIITTSCTAYTPDFTTSQWEMPVGN